VTRRAAGFPAKGKGRKAVVTLGLPKGSLQESTFELFRRAGFRLAVGSREYFPEIDDEEIDAVLLRAQEISRYVEAGVLDVGLTGHDWVVENGSDVVEVCELFYSKASARPARWVLAVPVESRVQRVGDLEGKLIATELVATTERYLAKHGVRAKVEFSWGATEAKAGLVDAIVELTETGRSLAANNLRIVDTVMESTTRVIANTQAWQDARKRAKIESLGLLLTGALVAQSKVGLKLNVSSENLEAVLAELPAMRRPTVSSLWGGDWHAVEAIIDESVAKVIIPRLKRLGAEGIIEYPLNKVIP
jgi:ATP phosphoribosyltransferase